MDSLSLLLLVVGIALPIMIPQRFDVGIALLFVAAAIALYRHRVALRQRTLSLLTILSIALVAIATGAGVVYRSWPSGFRRAATPYELAQSYVRGVSFRIADLAGPTQSIKGKTFEDCTVSGPAFVVLTGTGILQHNKFDAPVDVLFLEIPTEMPLMAAIVVEDSVFRRCEFSRIQFFIAPGQRQRIIDRNPGLVSHTTSAPSSDAAP